MTTVSPNRRVTQRIPAGQGTPAAEATPVDQATPPVDQGIPAAEAPIGWSLVPTLVVRSAGFGWHLLDGLRHHRAALAAERLTAALTTAETLRDRLGAQLPSGVRLTRGQAARLRNYRPLPIDAPVPSRLRADWDAAAAVVEWARREWAAAEALDERDSAAAVAVLAADPRVQEAVVCSGPAVYRDLVRAAPTAARLRRQVASYAQRLAAKCETMSVFGPINYATVDAAASQTAVLVWKGPQVWSERRAYLSAWAFDRLLAAVLAEPGTAAGVVPRRSTFAGAPSGDGALALLVRAADGVRTVDELAVGAGLTEDVARVALDDAVGRGLLTHDLIPPAVVVDQTRWLAGRLAERARQDVSVGPDGRPAWAAAARRVSAVLQVLDRYPAADAATKLRLQGELPRVIGPGPADDGAVATGDAGRGSADEGRNSESRTASRDAGYPQDARYPADRKFYNDRVIVTEAAAGTLELTIGGGLAHDLRHVVPAALDLLARTAGQTRWRCNTALARSLGPGRFPLTAVLRTCGDLPIPAATPLTSALAELIAHAEAGTPELDLAELDLADLSPDLPDLLDLPDLADLSPDPPDLSDRPEPAERQEFPVLCSADVMVAVHDLHRYRPGETLLVVGDVHDAALLTPWALQFHPDAAGVLAERDREIVRALGPHRAAGVVARRRTGLPPLRFPGPVVELGTVDGPAERLPLDRLEVHSDGRRAQLRFAGDDRELFLHNGELDSGVHTALALPRVRPLPLPDLPYVPRLRHRNVVLARRRWRLSPGPLDGLPEGPVSAQERLLLGRTLRAAGIPDRFFAKASHQRKPVFVDLDSPLLVDVLHRLADGAERVHAGEVLPDRDESWLRDGDGAVAAELRCVYLRPTTQGGPR